MAGEPGQGNRGGSDQEWLQGASGVQEGEQAPAGGDVARRREALSRGSISLRGGVRPPRTLQTPAAEPRVWGPCWERMRLGRWALLFEKWSHTCLLG